MVRNTTLHGVCVHIQGLINYYIRFLRKNQVFSHKFHGQLKRCIFMPVFRFCGEACGRPALRGAHSCGGGLPPPPNKPPPAKRAAAFQYIRFYNQQIIVTKILSRYPQIHIFTVSNSVLPIPSLAPQNSASRPTSYCLSLAPPRQGVVITTLVRLQSSLTARRISSL